MSIVLSVIHKNGNCIIPVTEFNSLLSMLEGDGYDIKIKESRRKETMYRRILYGLTTEKDAYAFFWFRIILFISLGVNAWLLFH